MGQCALVSSNSCMKSGSCFLVVQSGCLRQVLLVPFTLDGSSFLMSGSILRRALDKIAEIKSLLEERRIGLWDNTTPSAFICATCTKVAFFSSAAAKMAGVYSDSDPPRKTMRRGVLMTLLQQSAMTLPLWIGKPGER